MKPTLYKRLTALALGILLLLGTCLPALAAWSEEELLNAPNLVQNPGFEQGAAGWSLVGKAAPAKEAAYTGQSGILIDSNDQPTTPLNKVEQDITLPKSGDYELSFRLKLNIVPPKLPNAAVRAALLSGDGSRTLDLLSHSTRESGDWMRLSKRIFIPEDWANQSITLSFWFLSSQKSYLDDVCLTPAEKLGPPLSTDPAQNIVANPDFENGLGGWTSSKPDSMLQSSVQAHTGKHSLCVSDGATVSTDVTAGQSGEYELTAYFRAPAVVDKRAILSLKSMGESFNTYLMHIPIPRAEEWVKLTCTVYLASPGAYLLSLNTLGIDTLYVDDVSLIPTGYDLNNPTFRPDQLLQNGGFEHQMASWTVRGAGIYTTDTMAKSGSNAAYFSYFTSEPMNACLEQAVPSKGAGAYTLSAYLKPDVSLTGVGGILMLEARDKEGRVLKGANSHGVYDPAGGWQKLSVTLNVPAGAASLAVKIGGVYCTGMFYADDVLLVRNP